MQTPSATTSYDQSGVFILDLSPVLDEILLDDATLLGIIGVSREPATQTKHEWEKDELNPVVVTGAAAALNISATTLLLSASQYSRVTAGTLIKDQLSGKYEVLQVTAVSTVSATVTRGYGNSSGETHAASAVYDIIANARPEGMDGPKDESTIRTKEYNYTEIFSKGIEITGTAEAIKKNAIGSETSKQIDNRMRELTRELDRTLIMGIRAATNHSDEAYGTMGGIIDFVKYATGANSNTTAETLTPSVVDAMVLQCWDKGGTPDILLVGGRQKQKISAFDKEYRRTTMDSRRAGMTVDEYISDLGVNLRVVVERWMPIDCAMVLDSSKISVHPLTGRAFFLEKLAKTGDKEKYQIVGEYTAEVRSASKSHAIHTNLKR